MKIKLNNLNQLDVQKISQKFYNKEDQQKSEVGQQIVQVQKYEIESFSEIPIGFLGQHLLLTVDVTVGHHAGSVPEICTFFIKTLPADVPDQCKYITEFGAFKKEIFVYRNLLPDLQKSTNTQLSASAYLYKEFDIMVLDNLSTMGFEMATVSKGTGRFDVQHMIVALNTLAAFHATSLAVEQKANKSITDLYPAECFNEIAYGKTLCRQQAFQNSVTALSGIIRKITKYQHNLEYILPRFQNVMERIFDLVKPSSNFRNCVGHGDLWGNNVMFKYAQFIDGNSRNDRIPVEAVLVDFQLVRYAPPALDILTLITITSDSDFREQYLEKLLNQYYGQLESELQLHQIDIKTILPISEFRESCEYFKLAGLIESGLFSHITLLPSELSDKMLSKDDYADNYLKSREEICCKAYEISENYRVRLNDILSQIIDLYILEK